MKALKLSNITHKDSPIYYRRNYTAQALLDIMGKEQEVPVEFTIETLPSGGTEITITEMGEVDYPRAPLLTEVKRIIIATDSSGGLPV
ncbi:MAG: hypothetical protein LBM77_13705 [Spirochaetaceae bacterium]|jgi:hypothetical protein|nr:hypothetical protein [Spirochaetaceae bacterium]